MRCSGDHLVPAENTTTNLVIILFTGSMTVEVMINMTPGHETRVHQLQTR